MNSLDVLGLRFTVGQSQPLSPPGNDNRRLKPDWMTPEELMQWVRQEKERLSRAVAKDARLWSCPKHRREWDMTIAIEKLTLRQCYGVLDG
jgi:hypothetical protein